MAEFRLGRLKFNWRGDWTVSTAYVIDDVVSIGGNVYVCVVNHTSAGTADGWYGTDFNIGTPRWELMVAGVDSVGIFTSGTYYGPNDVVSYGGVLYRTLTPHVGTAFTNAYFTPYVEGFGNVTSFSTTTDYKLRDLASYSGNVYLASTAIAASNTYPNVSADWDLLVTGISTSGIATYSNAAPYSQGTVVTYGGDSYIAIASSVPAGIVPDGAATSADNWAVLARGLRNQGAWSTSTTYYRNDVVTYTSSSYVGISTLSIGNQPDVSPSQWQQLAAGAGGAVLTDRGDLLTRSASAPTRIGLGSQGMVLQSDGTDPLWEYFGNQKDNYYVGQNGSDTDGDGKTLETAWRTIGYALTNVSAPAAINVFAGTYAENLPMTIPEGVDIIGSSQRQVFIQPATAGMGTTTMFFMSNNTLIADCTVRGLCGYAKTNDSQHAILGVKPGEVGCYFMLNPSSPILTKSPYIRDVTCFSGPSISARVGFPGNTGSAIGAYIDGAVHAGAGVTGAQSMVMDAYTQVNDEGIGIWVDNLGKAELVSIFTYFCDFGYVSNDGGIIRSLNGNNSYGQYALASFNTSPLETPKTAYVVGERLDIQATTLTGSISVGQSITGNDSGAVGFVIDDQTAADPPFVLFEYDYINNPVVGFTTAEMITFGTPGVGETARTAATVPNPTGTRGFLFHVSGLTEEPQPRGVIQFGDTQYSGLGSDGKTTYGLGVVSIGVGTDANAYTLSAVTDYVPGTFGVVGTYNTTQLALGAQGTYTNVPVTGDQSGGGTFLTVGVGTTGYVESIEVTTPGGQYVEGEQITIDGSNIGGLAGAAVTAAVFPKFGTAVLRLAEEKTIAAATKQKATIVYDYSQIRVTGHDFLDIGIGGTLASRYPLKPNTQPIEGNQINEYAPARIFFVTSDQDGNFRVGNYFRVDQATGSATLNASAFNLSGLTELRLGSLGGQIGVAINEFSADGTLSGNSDTAVPTERAVKTYVDSIDVTNQPKMNITGVSTATRFIATDVSVVGPSTFTGLDKVEIGVGNTALTVTGDARITGILTVGESSITINPDTETIDVQKLNVTGISTVGSLEATAGLNVTGVLTASQSITVNGITQTAGIAYTVFGGQKNTYTDPAPKGGYTWESRTFWGPGEFVTSTPMNIDFIVIGGGGGGSQFYSTQGNGGGGAGGLVIGRGVPINAGSYGIRVGEGASQQRAGYPGNSGDKGRESWIYGPGLNVTALGGGGGQTPGAPPTHYNYGSFGGCGGGQSHGSNQLYWSQNGHQAAKHPYPGQPSPMSVTNYDTAPFYNSGVIKSFGEPGGAYQPNPTSYCGGGGGGVGGGGRPSTTPGHGNGGAGFECTWTNGTSEWLAGGGGGGGNSSEPSGDGHSGGGRGYGSTPTHSYTNPYVSYNQKTSAPYGMTDMDAKPGTGSGGGAGSYWAWGNATHTDGRGGQGGSGRVIIRWRTA